MTARFDCGCAFCQVQCLNPLTFQGTDNTCFAQMVNEALRASLQICESECLRCTSDGCKVLSDAL